MSMPPSPEQKSLVGYTIGRCKLLRICGRGAMGTVYKGMHGGLDIEVAVKILPPHLANNSNLVERFLREAKLAARLNHINTVRVYDVGEESGYNYLVMEFIDGTDALELVKRHGPQKAAIVSDIGAGAARALEHAHAHDVIHRDIKPANLMLPNTGGVKVADFGLARALASESGLTMTGAIMGTPDYMAPEQAQGESVGPSADIYSLGATLYHLFVGRPPYAGSSPMAVALQHVTNRIVVPEEKVKDETSRQLTRMIHELTHKDPKQRPDDLAVIARRLQEIARQNRGTEKLLSEGATLYSTAGFQMDAKSINKAKEEEARAQLNDKGSVQSPHLDKLRQAAEKARSGMHAALPEQAAQAKPMPSEMAELTGDMVREARAKARRSSGQLPALGPDGARKASRPTQRTSNPAMSPHRDQRPTGSGSSSRRNKIVQNPELEDDAWQSYAAKSFPTFEKSSIMDGSARTTAAEDRASAIRQASDAGSSPGVQGDFSTPSNFDHRPPRRRSSSNIASLLVAVVIIVGIAGAIWFFVLRDQGGGGAGTGDGQHIQALTAAKFQAYSVGEDVTAIAPEIGGATYFSASENGLVIRWDAEGRKPEAKRELSMGRINAMQMRADGTRLAVAGSAGIVALLDPETLEVVRSQEMRIEGAVTALQMIGMVDMIVGDDKGRLTLSSGTVRIQVDEGGAPITSVVYTNNEIWASAGTTVGRYQIRQGELHEVALISGLNGTVSTLVASNSGVFAMVGKTIVEVSGQGPGSKEFEAHAPVLGATSDGRYLFTVGESGVQVLLPRTLELAKSAVIELQAVTVAGASGDAGKFYLGTAGGEIIMCSLR